MTLTNSRTASMKDNEKENRFIRFTLHTSGNVKFLDRSTSIFLNIIREPLDFELRHFHRDF